MILHQDNASIHSAKRIFTSMKIHKTERIGYPRFQMLLQLTIPLEES